jgi:hypothetical protein
MNHRKHGIQTMKILAKENGLKFISDKFNGVSELHIWECAKGHQWNARPYNIKYIPYGKCPKCSKRAKVTIEDLSEMVEKKGGVLLSNSITSLKSVIKIQCAHKHVWESQAANIRQGKWCHECGGSKPLEISVLHEMAKKKGGKCLSTHYTNANAKYEWQCSEGHVWKAKYGNVYWGNWCKKCIDSLGERICRSFFEQLFKTPFPSSFPKWLKTKERNKLELDGYNEDLKLAFEHQGEQHYGKSTQFIKSDAELAKRIEYDLLKKKLCFENGVTLIEIPEINNKIKVNDLKNYIKEACLKSNITLPLDYDAIVVDPNESYKTPWWREKLEKQKEIARSKGGECLSLVYKSNDVKLEYKCKEGHVWNAAPAKISFGRWCPECAINGRANKRRHTIEKMNVLALKKGGLCLSSTYLSSQHKLKWSCSENHVWEAAPSSITQGGWCPDCASKQVWITRRKNQILEDSKLNEKGFGQLKFKL